MGKRRIFTEEEINQMIQMYMEGETYKVIGQSLHTKAHTVSTLLKSMGYEKRKKNTLKNHEYLSASRKNKLDENFFKEINTESKAYWLGFLYADGYVCKRHDNKGNEKGGVLEVALQARDKYHIQNFLVDIKSTAQISNKEIELNNNKYLASRVCVFSIKMVNDLISHGCIENKSLTLEPPTTIPQHLLSHFIRGYFDGDGCVAFYPERSAYRYSVLGTKAFLEFIVKASGVKTFYIKSFTHKNCYELIISTKESIEIFHNYIYKDKTIYLERKYQKSLAMMKWCKLEDSRNETQKMADLLGNNLLIDDAAIEDFEAFEAYLCYPKSETAAMADLLD